MADLTCDFCGGTDFYKESGYYYCNECQVQSQAIREHEFEEPEGDTPVVQKTTKIRKKEQDENPENQWTSWECYNYILLGLVKEMISLGANKELKKAVKTLWYKYLKYLQVIGNTENFRPKLPAVNNKIDAEILYGRRSKVKKRRRSRSPTSTSGISSMDASSIWKERAAKRRTFEAEEYLNTQQSETTSVHNQTLFSLKSSTPTTIKTENYLQYNRNALKEMKKHLSRNHLIEHRHDNDSLLNCHKFSYKTVSRKYITSPNVLTRCKVYSLIYIGLLIIQDKIQLGDMLRFIREGHLSFNEYKHFFPEELANTKLNISTYAANTSFLTHHNIRETALKIINALKVGQYIPNFNIIELSTRYCRELNLPNDIIDYVINIISRVPPKMDLKQKTAIPNYEARTMSIVIYALKLLFGLDGSTEMQLSEIAEKANATKNSRKLFNWKEWMTFIQYRRHVLEEEHFPIFYLKRKFDNPSLFISYLKEHKLKWEEKVSENYEMEVLKSNFEKIRSMQDKVQAKRMFNHSLTPFTDYIRNIINTEPENDRYSLEILKCDYSSVSVDFLVSPQLLRKYVYSDITVINDTSVKLVPIKNLKHEVDTTNENLRKLVTVELGENSVNAVKPHKHNEKLDTKKMLKIFKKHSLKRHIKNLEEVYDSTNSDHFRDYYQPCELFWINSQDILNMNLQQFEEFFSELPHSFQLLIAEGARVTEQSVKHFYEEYSFTELYLCYKGNFLEKLDRVEGNYEPELKRLLNIAVKNW